LTSAKFGEKLAQFPIQKESQSSVLQVFSIYFPFYNRSALKATGGQKVRPNLALFVEYVILSVKFSSGVGEMSSSLGPNVWYTFSRASPGRLGPRLQRGCQK